MCEANDRKAAPVKERGVSEYTMALNAAVEKFNNEWPEDGREPMYFSTSMLSSLFNQRIGEPMEFKCVACGHEAVSLFEDIQDPISEFADGLVMKISAKCPKCGEQSFLWVRATWPDYGVAIGQAVVMEVNKGGKVRMSKQMNKSYTQEQIREMARICEGKREAEISMLRDWAAECIGASDTGTKGWKIEILRYERFVFRIEVVIRIEDDREHSNVIDAVFVGDDWNLDWDRIGGGALDRHLFGKVAALMDSFWTKIRDDVYAEDEAFGS